MVQDYNVPTAKRFTKELMDISRKLSKTVSSMKANDAFVQDAKFLEEIFPKISKIVSKYEENYGISRVDTYNV